ncbi:hypothetical protein ACNSOL_01465 [Aliarcobacter lanthieri]|uniref:hypothetical protein n=1 Tax=Aliarcobacter lanthieri TaxID=1355374 RepID=UPI003AADB897
MNEILHLLNNFHLDKKIKVEKLDISEAVKIKDMQTIIKDTKAYLENLRKGFENAK